MNIYVVTADGTARIWKARSLVAAVELDEDLHIANRKGFYLARGVPFGADDERRDRAEYQKKMLESVTLIGELENP